VISFEKYPGSLSSKELTEGALLLNFKFEALLLVSIEDFVEFKLSTFDLLAEDFLTDESGDVWFIKRLFPDSELNSLVLLERLFEADDFFDEVTVFVFSVDPDGEDFFENELELGELFLDELDINSFLEEDLDELFSEELDTNSLFEDKDEDKLLSDELDFDFNSLLDDEDDIILLIEDLEDLFSFELGISLLLEEELFLDESWEFELEFEFFS